MNVLRRLDRLIAPHAHRSPAITTCLWPQRCRNQSSTSSSGGPNSTVTLDASEVRGVAQILRQQRGNLGQPTSVSHPHLIRPDELVPGVEMAEFKERRNQLMQNIRAYARSFGGQFNGHSSASHMLVLGAASKKYMSGKIPYVFRQNSDFYYLTGCLEPDAVLLLTIDEAQSVQSELFMRPKDPHAELWDGPRTGPELAVPLFGVTEAHPLAQLATVLAKRAGDLKPHIWFDQKNCDLPSLAENMVRLSGQEQRPLLPAYTFVEAMRLLKSRAEMQLMRRTCDIAARSFNEVMAESRPGQSEHHLFAAIDYKCRMRNASHLAYPPVVAAGQNATVIHYVSNSQLLGPHDLVLMDAGCEYGGYTSDITRTWPAGGRFTEPQRTLYEMLHQLQAEIIGAVMKPGGETLDQLFETTCYKLGKYLQEIGLVAKSVSEYKELAGQGYRFCPHHVSHYLGMDVHDTPHVPRNTRLVPGMVFTVEPGIYIGHDCGDVPPEFRGIGIRIEDDLLINEHGQVEVLTDACVKDPRALQELCQQRQRDDSGATAL
ncbi:xaa-Pro aminopeptidase 3 [Drosophila elegans]|uniref:xaa-Pro aminopeptidase 3 n=1 Tax=Drosophila elegans TaxID=30023 RepID=UPI0007E7AF5B|nr:xaa-Pro aminopeptidase 3 [Drosophila elegans]